MRKNRVLTWSISSYARSVRYLIMFQRCSGFCNMQMRCLMTSSTPHRPNKLPQMRNKKNTAKFQ